MGIDAEHRTVVGWPHSRFVELVGCEQPIIQAPMAGVGGTDLCVAAMMGGALGSLPCAMLSPGQVRDEVREVRARAHGPLNLNFFCHKMPGQIDDRAWRALLRPYYDEFCVEAGNGTALRLPFDEQMCAVVEELKPEVVSFHFGLPEAPLIRRVKSAGALVIGNATSVEEALWLQDRGTDAIIAQGFEAGGHTGRFLESDPSEALGLFALLPQVAKSVTVPVIAAGAIADGRAVAAAMILGASAVQLGTAFLHSPETPISDVHRKGLREGRTVLTNLMTGGLARGLRGRLIDDLGPVRTEVPAYPFASAALAPIRSAAEKQGEFGFGPMWAGQAAPLGRPLPAADLVRGIASDALAILTGRP